MEHAAGRPPVGRSASVDRGGNGRMKHMDYAVVMHFFI